MEEFVKKLIEKLKEHKIFHTQFDGIMPEQIDVICINTMENVINQFVEEYNNGWILCSERMPDDNVWVLVSLDDNTVCEAIHMNGNWYCSEWILENEVLAWMPEPAPYKAINK